MYTEDELLPLSGLQHIAFCERQWALIHVERQWNENRLTAEGRVLHDRVHEQTEEARRDVVVPAGTADALVPARVIGADGCGRVYACSGRKRPGCGAIGRTHGLWRPQPVEYKRGKAKREACDRVQLCAQALCLEEMLGVTLPEGALYYGDAEAADGGEA